MYLKHIIYHIFRKFFLDNHCLLTFLRSFYLEDRDTYLLVFMHIKIITRSRCFFSLDIKGATEFYLILGITSYQVWSSSPKHKWKLWADRSVPCSPRAFTLERKPILSFYVHDNLYTHSINTYDTFSAIHTKANVFQETIFLKTTEI